MWGEKVMDPPRTRQGLLGLGRAAQPDRQPTESHQAFCQGEGVYFDLCVALQQTNRIGKKLCSFQIATLALMKGSQCVDSPGNGLCLLPSLEMSDGPVPC